MTAKKLTNLRLRGAPQGARTPAAAAAAAPGWRPARRPPATARRSRAPSPAPRRSPSRPQPATARRGAPARTRMPCSAAPCSACWHLRGYAHRSEISNGMLLMEFHTTLFLQSGLHGDGLSSVNLLCDFSHCCTQKDSMACGITEAQMLQRGQGRTTRSVTESTQVGPSARTSTCRRRSRSPPNVVPGSVITRVSPTCIGRESRHHYVQGASCPTISTKGVKARRLLAHRSHAEHQTLRCARVVPTWVQHLFICCTGAPIWHPGLLWCMCMQRHPTHPCP